jgi:hypothetical protein
MNPSIRRVRLQLTAWYIAVIGLILIAFGAAVYKVVDVQTQAGLDRSLERTVDRRTKMLLTRHPEGNRQDTALYDRRVFVFDARGNRTRPNGRSPGHRSLHSRFCVTRSASTPCARRMDAPGSCTARNS